MAITNAVSGSREPPSAGPIIGGNLTFLVSARALRYLGARARSAVTDFTRICADSRSLGVAFRFSNRLPLALDGGTTTKVFAGFRPNILTSRHPSLRRHSPDASALTKGVEVQWNGKPG